MHQEGFESEEQFRGPNQWLWSFLSTMEWIKDHVLFSRIRIMHKPRSFRMSFEFLGSEQSSQRWDVNFNLVFCRISNLKLIERVRVYARVAKRNSPLIFFHSSMNPSAMLVNFFWIFLAKLVETNIRNGARSLETFFQFWNEHKELTNFFCVSQHFLFIITF